MKDYKEVVRSWLEGNFDAETKAEIKKLQETDPVNRSVPVSAETA